MSSTRTAGAGAELTAEQVSTILTQPLEQASVFLASGVQIMDTTGPLRIPTAPTFDLSENGSRTFWHGESEQITESDPDYDELSLLPSTMKSVKVITRYSNELARAAVVALDRVLQSRLVTDVAAKIDGQFLSGGGDGITLPRGMFAWDGTQSVAVGGPITLDHVLDAQALALAANVPAERLRLFLRPEDFIALRRQKDGDDRYMLQPDATQGQVPTVLGMPVTVSARIPVGNGAVADPSQVVVARDMAPSVKVLTERYADYDEQALRVVARYDAAPLNAPAVVKFTGISD